MINNRYFRITLVVAICCSLLAATNVLQRRFQYERQDRQVEFVMERADIQKLADLSGHTFYDMVRILQRDGGLTSISIGEDTLDNLKDDGRVTVLRGSDIQNAARVGLAYSAIAPLTKDTVNPGRYYLLFSDDAVYKRVKDYLQLQLGTAVAKEVVPRLLSVGADEQTLKALHLGFTKLATVDLPKGIRLVPRISNSNFVTKALIEKKFDDLRGFPRDGVLIFEGDQCLGYPALLNTVKEEILGTHMKVGVIEFFDQLGTSALASRFPNRSLRVHSIADEEMKILDPKIMQQRYVRAVKERHIRVVFLHPMLDRYSENGVVALNTNYMNNIRHYLGKSGYHVEAITQSPLQRFRGVTTLEIAGLSLGTAAVLILLISRFVAVSWWVTWATMGLTLLLGYAADLTYMQPLWIRLLAVTTAASIPALAVISQLPKSTGEMSGSRYVRMAVVMGKIFGISIFGAVLMASYLASPKYLTGLMSFSGVKIAFLSPLFLVSIYFYLGPHRVTAFAYVIKRIWLNPVRTGMLVGLFAAGALLVVYILRSGNYMPGSVPGFETKMRESFETLLYVRPRTKEFLFGYPILVFAILQLGRTVSDKRLWVFAALGTVASVSLVNSFCHVHTPLAISLLRSSLGLFLGILLGVIAEFGYRVASLWFSRFR